MTVAATLAIMSLLIPPVGIVSSASVALVTLRRGALEGLIVLLSACFAASILGIFLVGNYLFAIGNGLLLWLPVWLISIVLREGRHLSLAIEIAVIFGAIGVVGFYIYSGDPFTMWKQVLDDTLLPVLSMSKAPVEQVQISLDLIAHVMTGIIAAGFVSGLLLGLLLGRWWQASLYNPGGFRKEFLTLKTQPRMGIGCLGIFAIALMASGVFSEIAWNITFLLFVLYTFIGTAVVHVLISAMKASRFLLPFFYVLIFIIPHTLLPIACIGLGDVWLNFRNKLSNHNSV